MKAKWMKWGLLAVMSTSILTACQNQPKNEADTVSGASIKTPREIIKSPVKKTDFLLGTAVALSVYHPNTEEVITNALEMIKDLEKRITVNASGSEVDEVNLAAGEKPVKVSADVYELIKLGLKYSEEFDGAFDITVGPLTQLWHIGFDDAKKPTQEEIDAVLPLVNYKDVELNDAEQTVFLKRKGMQLDLGGIAKGYIADKVWGYFAKEGITTAVIDLGGNIVVMGGSPARDGVAWNVGIQDPDASRGKTLGTILEKDKTIVTSGIYERYLTVDGQTYHHILNPKTGYPYDNNVEGVSVIVDSSTKGDALSTSMFSVGPKAGIEYANSHDGIDVIFVTKDKKVYVSNAIKDTFKLTNTNLELKESVE